MTVAMCNHNSDKDASSRLGHIAALILIETTIVYVERRAMLAAQSLSLDIRDGFPAFNKFLS